MATLNAAAQDADGGQLRLPLSAQSVAGYAALARRLLNLNDVYDAAELQRYAAELRFQQGVDRRTGYRTTQMLVVPILHDGEVIGVLQLINNLRGGPFDSTGFVGALGSRALGREQVEQAVEQAPNKPGRTMPSPRCSRKRAPCSA
jgi:hypothetical protein